MEQDFRQVLDYLQNRYSQTIKIGGKSLRIGSRKFGASQIPEAMTYMRENAISNAFLFRPGGKAADTMIGPQSMEWLRKFANDSNLTVELLKHKTKGLDKDAFLREFSGNAIVVPDTETFTTFRAWSGNRLLSRDELVTSMRDVMDYVITQGPKTGKRIKAHTSMRSMQAMFDRPLNLQVYDPRLMYEGLNAREAKLAEEGISIINPRTVREVARDMMDRAATISEGPARDALEREAASLYKAAYEGGTFNIRAEGFRVYDQVTGKQIKDAFGQIKGNTIVGNMKTWGQMYGDDVDIITAFTNLKPETGNLPGSSRSNITLDARHVNTAVRMDVQAVVSSPELYPERALVEHTQRIIDQYYNQIAAEGRIPDGMIRHARDVIDGKKTYPSVFIERKQKAFARQVLDYAESGMDIRKDPQFLQSLMSTYEKHLRSSKKPLEPNFFVPDATGAYVTNERVVRAAGWDLPTMKEGQVALMQDRWIMSPKDIARYYESGGGWDQDDYVAQMLRWDEETNTLKALGKRPPTARGEEMLFDIDPKDPSVVRIMRDRLGDDVVDEFGWDKLEKFPGDLVPKVKMDKWEQLVRENVTHIASTREIAERSISSGNQLFGIYLYDFPTPERIQDEIDKAMNAKMATYRANAAAYSVEDEIRGINSILNTNYELERYANTRIVMEDFLRMNEGAFRNLVEQSTEIAGEVVDEEFFKIYSQERIIDMMVDAAAGERDVSDVADVIEEMQKRIGLLLSQDDFVIDEALYEARFSETAAFTQGLRAGGYTGDIDLKKVGAEDERAIWSRLTQKFEETIDRSNRRQAKIVQQANYADEIMFASVSEGSREDARRLATAYKIAREKWKDRDITSLEQMQDMLTKYGEAVDTTDLKDRAVSNEVRKVFVDMFEDDGTMGRRAREALVAYMQEYGDGEQMGIFRGPMLDAKLTVRAWYETGGADIRTVGEMPVSSAEKYKRLQLARREIRADHLIDTTAEDLNITDDLADAMREAPETKIGRKTADFAEAAKSSLGARWEDFGWQSLKRLWNETPSLRKAGIGAGIAILGSFAYQATKDRSPEDMQGPPLLPGGSAYESDYYKGDLPQSLGNTYANPNMSGITYRVNVRGGMDPRELRNNLEGIAGTTSSGTIYSVPNPQQDIFDVISESFG